MNVIDQAHGENWSLYNADSAEALQGIPDKCIGLAVFSPPFSTLYTYSASDRDLGNCSSDEQFWDQFGYISRELHRVMQPGRNVCVHVAQIPSQKVKDGVIGLKDFRGDTIRHFQSAGFTFHGEAVIQKNPQAQAIRTKSKGLLFTQMRKDSIWSRPALADYILVFRAPGENTIPIHPDITNDQWIEWAAPIWSVETTEEDRNLFDNSGLFDLAPGTPLLWYGIRETDTLNVAEGREAEDERHICPLQLGTIERCVRLWSNPGETVLSPFAGIGSEGFVSVKQGRRFVGVELKPSYYRAGVRNIRRAEGESKPLDMFALMADEAVS